MPKRKRNPTAWMVPTTSDLPADNEEAAVEAAGAGAVGAAVGAVGAAVGAAVGVASKMPTLF